MQQDWQRRGEACLGKIKAPAARGFTLIELLVVVVIIGVLAAIALPNYIKLKDKAKEAETKAGLHKIQTDLERYSVDNHGEYPPYLIGGELKMLDVMYDDNHNATTYVHPTSQPDARDPMLREGYVDSFPHNPFITHPGAVQQFQQEVGDPLRNMSADAETGGTRFGPYGDTMGQVLCDSRWLKWHYVNQFDQSTQDRWTWSNVQYEFYDAWGGPAARPFLPGSFMYKSMGELNGQSNKSENRRYCTVDGQTAMVPDDSVDQVYYPAALTNYILGAWGSPHTKGQDILGEEPLVIFRAPPAHSSSRGLGQFFYDPTTHRYTATPTPAEKSFSLIGIPPWTRGVNRAHVGPLWGSPYGPAPGSETQLSDSNPNGLRDGLVLVLTGGAVD